MKAYSNEYSPKIVIIGDSWGCGEWDHKSNLVTHKGLEQFLIDSGHDVTNLSKGGTSILYAIQSLNNYLITQSTDIVIFVQTDPIRNISPYTNLTDAIAQNGSIKNLANKILLNSYEQLNDIATEKQLDVYLIGGLFNIIPHNFLNLKTACKSWVHLLVGHFTEYATSKSDDFGINSSDWGIDNINLSAYNKSMAMTVVDEVYTYVNNSVVFREDIFYPDGVHPNRMGHKILFEHIYETIFNRT